MSNKMEGFTVVELLVTLIVGILLLFSSYQLYSYVLDNDSDARMRAAASVLAYRFMREGSASATSPCIAKTITPAPTIPPSTNLPLAAASVKIACSPSGPSTISIITSTVTYGSPQKSVTHAVYVKP